MVDTEVVHTHKQGNIEPHAEVNGEEKELSKHVVFDQSVRVILIPSRGEYRRVGLYSVLWWNSFEFGQFQASAQNEIRALASAEGIGARAARRKLYQPTLGDNGQWCASKRHSNEDFGATERVHLIDSTLSVLSVAETELRNRKGKGPGEGVNQKRDSMSSPLGAPNEKEGNPGSKTQNEDGSDDSQVRSAEAAGPPWVVEEKAECSGPHSTAGATPPVTPQPTKSMPTKSMKRTFDIAKYDCETILCNGPVSKNHRSHLDSFAVDRVAPMGLSPSNEADSVAMMAVVNDDSDDTSSISSLSTDAESCNADNSDVEKASIRGERGATTGYEASGAEADMNERQQGTGPGIGVVLSEVDTDTRPAVQTETSAHVTQSHEEGEDVPNICHANSMLNIQAQMTRSNSLDCLHLAKQGLLPDLTDQDRAVVESFAEGEDSEVPPVTGDADATSGGPNRHSRDHGSIAGVHTNARAMREMPRTQADVSPSGQGPPSHSVMPTGSSMDPFPLPALPTTSNADSVRNASLSASGSTAVRMKHTRSSGEDGTTDRDRCGALFSSDSDTWDSLLLSVPLLQPGKLENTRKSVGERYSWAGSRRRGVLGAGLDYLGLSSMGPLRVLGWAVVACSVYIMATDAASGDGDRFNGGEAMFGGNMTL